MASLLFLVSCDEAIDLDQPTVPLGDFKLGFNYIYAGKATKGPVSRSATQEEWEEAVKKAIDDRFLRYNGDTTYHFGISVEGYMLAPPGVPVVYKPKSVVILNVTVWESNPERKINDEPHKLVVFEDTSSGSAILGSGYDRTREEQLVELSENTARSLENWLVEMHETYGWFIEDAVLNPPPLPRPEEER
ncbi:MAG: hypothetical protein GDA40_11980 [Rhodobacteraceae bacterium]|nr:hypothetical protein [Paracoccaceae bacterium]